MEMHQIRYFVAMTRRLNFTRAAEDCNVTQPSLTRAIKKLEEELGGPLFRREGRRTHLTELGRMVRPRLERALSLADLAKSEALDSSKLINTKLDLGCMCTIAPTSVISLVEFFHRQVPKLKLAVHDDSGLSLARRIIDGELDVCLIALPKIPEELEAIPLYEEPYVIAIPSDHRFAKMDAVPLAELDGEQYLERLNCEYLDMFTSAGFQFDIELDERFQSEHETWIQAMVIAGLGCAIMPESLTTNPEICTRPLIEPTITRTISVVTRRGRRHTPVVEFFVNLCRRMDWGVSTPVPGYASDGSVAT